MKKLLGLVVIIVALVLGSYYGMGIITERTFKKNLEIVNQSNGLHVAVQHYNRKWFKSTAELDWRLHVPEHTINRNGQVTKVPAKDYTLQMPLVIHHGPIIFADSKVLFGLGYASTNIALPPDYIAEFDNLYTAESVKPLLNLSVFVNYLNKSELRAHVPGFKLISKEGSNQFEWLGMTSNMHISSTMDQVSGNVKIEGIRWIKDKAKAVFGKIDSDYDLHRTPEGLYLGDGDLVFPSILLMQNEQKIFEVDQFKVHSSSDVKDGLFSSSLKAGLEKLFAHGKFYGESSVDLALRNLDAKVLASINEQVNKMQHVPDNQRQQLLLSLLPELPQLVNKGAELEVSDLHVVLPDGTIKGDLLITLPNENINNPFQLIQKVQGHGKLDISAAVLKDLIKGSLKQKMIATQALQQSLTQQQTSPSEQQSDQKTTVTTTTTTTTGDATSTTTITPTVTAAATTSAPLSPAEIEQQAGLQADEKIATMVKAGLLLQQGTQYVFEMKLNQGQVVVNGKPFNPAMMQF